MTKRSYPPGQKRKRRLLPLSEYGKELREKQKLKNWYNLEENQLKKYVKEVLEKRGKSKEEPADFLIKKLEKRLDNVIFRLGFAGSRFQARQFVNHGHFLVNERKVNIPSFQVKTGDKISLVAPKIKKKFFQNLPQILKKQKLPLWLKLDSDKLEGKIIGEPSVQEIALPIEIPAVFEFYSR